jgi:hypothetical protein
MSAVDDAAPRRSTVESCMGLSLDCNSIFELILGFENVHSDYCSGPGSFIITLCGVVRRNHICGMWTIDASWKRSRRSTNL